MNVTVVLPSLNPDHKLMQVVEALVKGGFHRVLLVNDGSSDTSLPICQMYARVDARVRVIDRPNSGVSAARNAALAQAAGDYLQFVDSDDYLDPDATRLLVERALQTGADMQSYSLTGAMEYLLLSCRHLR